MKKLIQDGKFDPNKQLELSEQFLIDCSGSEGTAGCNGGMPQQAWRYVLKNKTMAKRPPYPYKGKVCVTSIYISILNTNFISET